MTFINQKNDTDYQSYNTQEILLMKHSVHHNIAGNKYENELFYNRRVKKSTLNKILRRAHHRMTTMESNRQTTVLTKVLSGFNTLNLWLSCSK